MTARNLASFPQLRKHNCPIFALGEGIRAALHVPWDSPLVLHLLTSWRPAWLSSRSLSNRSIKCFRFPDTFLPVYWNMSKHFMISIYSWLHNINYVISGRWHWNIDWRCEFSWCWDGRKTFDKISATVYNYFNIITAWNMKTIFFCFSYWGNLVSKFRNKLYSHIWNYFSVNFWATQKLFRKFSVEDLH